tara:strand:- start:2446 stop:3591 length:1146 start_codon:yes stop_codon:yes gene_type:complete
MTLPIAIIVVMLRPIQLIRFGPLRSERIGHFSKDTEIYLCQLDEKILSSKPFDIFYYKSPISNRQLKKMWDRILHVSRIAKVFESVFRILPGGRHHLDPISNVAIDSQGLIARTQPHLFFTPEEEEKGQKTLREWGIPKDAQFICFQSRDSKYLEEKLPVLQKDRWRYHKYRDSYIHSYIPAIDALVQEEYYGFRMGSVAKETLKINNPRIIDYASNGYRTDFMDIYLASKCKFFIGDTVGFNNVPIIFRRPFAFVNYIPMIPQSWSAGSLFIPKKLWVRNENRFLTFREILDPRAEMLFDQNKQYEKHGIEVIDNSPEEIAALSIEMDKRLKGTWHASDEDDELQERLLSIMSKSKFGNNNLTNTIMGAEFLRHNKNLLD